MSGGRFFVSLKDAVYSEKILKMKSLIREGFDINEDVKIDCNEVPSRKAGEHILMKFLSVDEHGFTCTGHESTMCSKVIRTVTNVFFNNKRKRSTEAVVVNRVKPFKKVKRTKSSKSS